MQVYHALDAAFGRYFGYAAMPGNRFTRFVVGAGITKLDWVDFLSPDLCTFRRSDSCVNSAANRGRAGMGLQLVDNTEISVHRILCTDLQEVTDTAIASGSLIFIGSQKEFCKAAMGAGFVLAARFQGNHAGDSRVSSSAVNSRRIQNRGA